MNKKLAKFLLFLVTAIIMGILGAIYSMIFAGAVDGIVLKLAPQANLQFAGYFLLCFIPTYLPGLILLWIYLNRQFPKFFDDSPAPADDEEE